MVDLELWKGAGQALTNESVCVCVSTKFGNVTQREYF